MNKVKAKQDHAETRRIIELVKHLMQGESLDVQTAYTARQLAVRLTGVQHDDQYHKDLRCKAIDGGVRVTCNASYRISVRHTHTTTAG